MNLYRAMLGACLSSSVYALLLHRITHLYHPDHTWLTVVGGNVLIWAWFTAAYRHPRAPHPPLLLVLINCAAGGPIIAWQLGQQLARDRAADRRHHARYARRAQAA